LFFATFVSSALSLVISARSASDRYLSLDMGKPLGWGGPISGRGWATEGVVRERGRRRA